MMLSIIIVSWNTRQDLLRCLDSIMAAPPTYPFEILVFDNASEDGSAEAVVTSHPGVSIEVSHQNLGFGRANNRAASSAQGRFWLLLNPDTIVHEGAIDTLVRYLEGQPQVAAVGPRLVNADGSLQPSIERLPTLYNEWWRLLHLERLYSITQYPQSKMNSRLPQIVEVLSGACLLLRRESVEIGGLFDEEYFMYSEEIDLCDRLHQDGWELHWVPEAVVTHIGGQSTRQVALPMFIELYRNKVKFFRKRRGRVAAWFYKLILFQAAFIRYMLGNLIQILPVRGRKELIEVCHRYGLLLIKLSSL
ncbi:MAG TPA: glycosyltransferase family 2 protein [Anaerolineales bacterium]|nr:glycosyltransferase family 2 protein [Anaerolineales bacterium]